LARSSVADWVNNSGRDPSTRGTVTVISAPWPQPPLPEQRRSRSSNEPAQAITDFLVGSLVYIGSGRQLLGVRS
jgi:hypothetical protein